MVQVRKESSATPQGQRRDSLVLHEAESNAKTVDQKVNQAWALPVDARISLATSGEAKRGVGSYFPGRFTSSGFSLFCFIEEVFYMKKYLRTGCRVPILCVFIMLALICTAGAQTIAPAVSDNVLVDSTNYKTGAGTTALTNTAALGAGLSCWQYDATGTYCVKGRYYRSDGGIYSPTFLKAWPTAVFTGTLSAGSNVLTVTGGATPSASWIGQSVSGSGDANSGYDDGTVTGNFTSGSTTVTLNSGTLTSAMVGITPALQSGQAATTTYLASGTTYAAITATNVTNQTLTISKAAIGTSTSGYIFDITNSGLGASAVITAVSGSAITLSANATYSISGEIFKVTTPVVGGITATTITGGSNLITLSSATGVAPGMKMFYAGTPAPTGFPANTVVAVNGNVVTMNANTSASYATAGAQPVGFTVVGEANYIEVGGAAGTGNGLENPCAGCHHGGPTPQSYSDSLNVGGVTNGPGAISNADNGSGIGPNYFVMGHRNMLKKVIASAGNVWADWAGNPLVMSGYNWTAATYTASGVTVPVYYLYGWTNAPDAALGVSPTGGNTYACARCHVTGYRFDAVGPEPSQATFNPATNKYTYAKLTDAQFSHGAQDGTCSVISGKANVTACQTAGGVWTTSSWFLSGIQCERCHNTDVQSNASKYWAGTQGRSSHEGVSGSGTADPTYASFPTIAVGSASTALCAECHRQEVDTTPTTSGTVADATGNTAGIAYNLGTIHPTQLPGGEAVLAATLTGPNQPTANSLMLFGAPTVACYNSANVLQSTTASCVAGTSGYYFTYKSMPSASHGSTGIETFLNSPHARFSGTFDQNAQNSPDLTVTGLTNAASYNSDFTNWGEAQNAGQFTTYVPATDNGGCAGCHDVHNSQLVDNVYQTSTAANAVLTTQNVASPFVKQCTDCHDGHTASGVNHPHGSNTPFDASRFPNSSGLVDEHGNNNSACVICHLGAATSGTAAWHYFRINPSATYTMLPTAAQYAAANPAGGVKMQPNTYVENVLPGSVQTGGTYNAVALDVDVACGQCHVGGNGAVSPYGLAVPAGVAIPQFTRTALADYAVNMHNSQAQAPTFSPASGTSVAPGATVTITSPQSYTLYYTTDGSTPTFASKTASGSASVTLTAGMVINAFAWSPETAITQEASASNGFTNYANSVPSIVATAKYNTITAKAPVIEPTAGTYSIAALPTVTIVDPWVTSGATIYYTTNGSAPTVATGTLYGGPFTLTTAGQVKAIAVVGGATSPVASTSYSYKVDQPAFSLLNGGQYPTKYIATTADAWFTDDDSNATICVGITPVTPVAGSCAAGTSAQLTTPLILSGTSPNTTITVYAYAYDGTAVSKVVSGTYLLDDAAAAIRLNKPVDIRLIKEAR